MKSEDLSYSWSLDSCWKVCCSQSWVECRATQCTSGYVLSRNKSFSIGIKQWRCFVCEQLYREDKWNIFWAFMVAQLLHPQKSLGIKIVSRLCGTAFWFHVFTLSQCCVWGATVIFENFLDKTMQHQMVVYFYKLFWRVQIMETEIADGANQFWFLPSLIFCYWHLKLIPLFWSSTPCYKNTWIHIQALCALRSQVAGKSLAVGSRP